LSLPMSHYMSTIDSLYRSEKFHVHKVTSPSLGRDSASIGLGLERSQSISTERCQSHQYAYHCPRNTCFHLIRHQLNLAHVEVRPLSDVVASLWNFRSREPLDQIYGLLGLAHDGDKISVNYKVRPLQLLVHFLDITSCSLSSSRLLTRLEITTHDLRVYFGRLPRVEAISVADSQAFPRSSLFQVLPKSRLPRHGHHKLAVDLPNHQDRVDALESHSWRIETDRPKDEDHSSVTWFCTGKSGPAARLQYLKAVVWHRSWPTYPTRTQPANTSLLELYFDQTCPDSYLHSLLRPPCGYIVAGAALSAREGRTKLGYFKPS
jgi:hypothetical protein